MPSRRTWTEPAPYLVSAALALAAGRHESCTGALAAAERLLDSLPAEQEAAGRLSAAVVRLGTALRTGDLVSAASAAGRAAPMLSRTPARKLARHPGIGRHVLCGRAAVELWSGHLDEAARVLEAGLSAEATSGRADAGAGRADQGAGRADQGAGWAGQLALVEALRGRLSHAAELASQAIAVLGERRPTGQHRDARPLVALAWVHLERNELPEARSFLKQADAALGESPDKLIGTVAYLVAASGALAEGRAAVAAQIVTRARSGWPVPPWLDQQLSLVESRAWAAAGDVRAALAAARRATGQADGRTIGQADGRTTGQGSVSPEAAVALAQAWAVAGEGDHAMRVLAPALADHSHLPEPVRLHAWLTDARLRHASGDDARARRTLVSALRLAEREQLRLPLVLERGWLGPVLRRDPELVDAHRRLLAPVLGHHQLPAPVPPGARAPALVVEPLTERELEVLTRVSGMLNTAEVASEMYISVNTVKTHLRNIYRKLSAAHRNEAVRRARQLQLI